MVVSASTIARASQDAKINYDKVNDMNSNKNLKAMVRIARKQNNDRLKSIVFDFSGKKMKVIGLRNKKK